MTQDTELERCARIVVKARSLFRLNSVLYYIVLNAAIDDLEGAVMQAELARQDAIPLPEFDVVKWREIAAGGCQREESGE